MRLTPYNRDYTGLYTTSWLWPTFNAVIQPSAT